MGTKELHRDRIQRQARGFTLVELVIVILLLSVISAVGSRLLSAGFNGYLLARDLTDADWQGRIALERMTRELRDIPQGNLNAVAANQVSFTDWDNVTLVTYSLAGNTLMRNARPLADGIAALNFTYLDSAFQVTAVPANVRYISVTVNVTQGGTNLSYRSAVYTRNL